uniref:DH domain-containing protein n=1 Tax=Macrostomum lignano TaxID=282301 RepID=A0A1I8FTB1_9PLAT
AAAVVGQLFCDSFEFHEANRVCIVWLISSLAAVRTSQCGMRLKCPATFLSCRCEAPKRRPPPQLHLRVSGRMRDKQQRGDGSRNQEMASSWTRRGASRARWAGPARLHRSRVPVLSVAEIFAQQFFNRHLDEDLMTGSCQSHGCSSNLPVIAVAKVAVDCDDRLRIRDRRSEKRLSAGVSLGPGVTLSRGEPGSSRSLESEDVRRAEAPSGCKPRRNSFTLLFPGPKDESSECCTVDAALGCGSAMEREKLAISGLPSPKKQLALIQGRVQLHAFRVPQLHTNMFPPNSDSWRAGCTTGPTDSSGRVRSLVARRFRSHCAQMAVDPQALTKSVLCPVKPGVSMEEILSAPELPAETRGKPSNGNKQTNKNNTTDSRVSVPVRSLDPDWCERRRDCQPAFSSVLAADSGWQQQGRSSSRWRTSPLAGTGRGSKEDKADAFLRNLRAAHLFQSSQAATSQDNRDKLHDYLRPVRRVRLAEAQQRAAERDQRRPGAGPGPSPPDRTLTAGKAVRQQAAIWELCQTELNILRHLKTIIEIYIAVIHYLQSSASLLLDVDTDRLFPDVAAVHLPAGPRACGHIRGSRPAEGLCRRIHPVRGDLRAGAGLLPAITESKDYLRQLEKNEAFNDFVKWAQKSSAKNYNSNDCSMDLQLKSLLTMPFQRLTKYGLLLQEIQRHTEDGEDREALELMVRVCEF